MASHLATTTSERPHAEVDCLQTSATFLTATVFLSAFLLFQIQPLSAKLILPWFGGSASVWITCLVFFQLILLLGYIYAHWLSRQKLLTQRTLHISALALSCCWFPIVPSPAWRPNDAGDPVLRILGLLAGMIGLPFLVLSATSPLLQVWYSRSNGNAMPYRYFAISNAGSMIGLVTYPFLIEPYLNNHQQTRIWSGLYCVFAVLCGAIAWRIPTTPQPSSAATMLKEPVPPSTECLLWVALAACPSALLLAVTHHLTEEISAVPLLWVLPLSLYLLSFILCFDSDRWYRRWLFAPLAAISLPISAWLVSGTEKISDLRLLDLKAIVAILAAATFVLFTVCHGELARRRPAPEHLTWFYLMIAVGGSVGGLAIAIAAPYLFNALYDLPLVLSLTGFLFVYLLWIAHPSPQATAELSTPRNPRDAKLSPSLRWRTLAHSEAKLVWVTAAAGVAFGFAGILARETWKSFAYARLLARNFYGSLVVYDDEMPRPMGPVRVLRNGTIDHGEQFLWPQNRHYATTYYAHNGGAGRALDVLMKRNSINVGVIGLGAGTLATYARPADHYYFYELDPNVVKIATTQFTFLQDCGSQCAIVAGDARLSLDREPSRQFDLLAVDAFSGDSIPTRLLTGEAFQLYRRHLKPDGVLAVHVSNKYLSLAPVIALAAAEDKEQAMLLSYDGNETNEEFSSDWALVTSRPGFFDLPEIVAVEKPIDLIPGLQMWTDNFSNLYRILR